MVLPNDLGNEDNAFPILPSFFRDPAFVRKDNVLIHNFERFFSLDSSYYDGITQSEKTRLKADVPRDASFTDSDGPEEDPISLASTAPKSEQRDLPSSPNTPNTVALSEIDPVIQRSKRCAKVEWMCEDIAKEIVERSADLYAASLFDAMKYIYTSFSVWDELREMVAHSFLTRDCRAVGTEVEGGGLFARPACAFALRAAEDLHVAARRGRGGGEGAECPRAGSPPELIPMDEYCRYVVECLSHPSFLSLSHDKSERNMGKRTASYMTAQTGPSNTLLHPLASDGSVSTNRVLGISLGSDVGHTSRESVLSPGHGVADSASSHTKRSPMQTWRRLSSSFRYRSEKSNSQGAITTTKWSGDGTIRIFPSAHDRPVPPNSQPVKGITGGSLRRAYAKLPSKIDGTHINQIKDTAKGVH